MFKIPSPDQTFSSLKILSPGQTFTSLKIPSLGQTFTSCLLVKHLTTCCCFIGKCGECTKVENIIIIRDLVETYRRPNYRIGYPWNTDLPHWRAKGNRHISSKTSSQHLSLHQWFATETVN